MEINDQPKLKFRGVDIVKVNFSVFSAPKPNESVKIDLSCDPKVFYPKDNRSSFSIVMDLSIKGEGKFEIQIRSIGRFNVNMEINEAIKKQFVNANAPAIMFPYLRAFVSTLTANVGRSIGALTIPTQVFAGDIEELSIDE